MAFTYGGRTLVTAGSTAAVSSDSFSATSDRAAADFDSDGARQVAFDLNVTYSSAPAALSTISIYLTPQSIMGESNDGIDPDNDYPDILVGVVRVNDVTTAQRILRTFSIEHAAHSGNTYAVSIRNNANQTISAGWTLHAQWVKD